jgi:hypothetical protein
MAHCLDRKRVMSGRPPGLRCSRKDIVEIRPNEAKCRPDSLQSESNFEQILGAVSEVYHKSRPDVANFSPDARQTKSDCQQFLRSLKAYK